MSQHTVALAPEAHVHPEGCHTYAHVATQRRSIIGVLEDWLLRLWSKPAWLAPMGILSCLFGASAYVLATNPTDAKPDLFGYCVFKATTGYDCPGCGGTRMVWYLLNGNFIQAGRHHLAVFLALPFLLYGLTAWAARRFSSRSKLPLLNLPSWLLIGYAGVFLAYAVARNIPAEPFNWFFV